jgi:hypothetical protein
VSGLSQSGWTAGPDGVREPRPHRGRPYRLMARVARVIPSISSVQSTKPASFAGLAGRGELICGEMRSRASSNFCQVSLLWDEVAPGADRALPLAKHHLRAIFGYGGSPQPDGRPKHFAEYPTEEMFMDRVPDTQVAATCTI